MKLSVSREEMQQKLANIQILKRKYNADIEPFSFERQQKGSYIIATDIETALKEPLEVTVERRKLCIPESYLR
jgi:hypothetical protein